MLKFCLILVSQHTGVCQDKVLFRKTAKKTLTPSVLSLASVDADTSARINVTLGEYDENFKQIESENALRTESGLSALCELLHHRQGCEKSSHDVSARV